MTDLRLQNRIGQDDREALEHIARALEGRVLPSNGSGAAPGDDTGGANGSSSAAAEPAAPSLDATGVESLIEAMPAAIGIVKDDALTMVNSAFAYAFGYRSPRELLDAGGLDAILPGGLADLQNRAPNDRMEEVAALSRSRRRLSVTFILSPLAQETKLRLLRLVDPSDLEPSEIEHSEIERSDPKASDIETSYPKTSESKTSDTGPERPTAEAKAKAETAGTSPAVTLAAVPVVTPVPDPRPADVPPQETHDAAEPAAPQPATPEAAGANDNVATDDADQRSRELASRQLDFLAKVSHEVRTPLNSIIGFAELMLHERFGPIGNARYKGYSEDIHQSGLYALSLLNDLLDISKIEAGKFELDFTSVDAAEVVEACVASLQPLAKRTRIVLRTSFADDLPMVVADPRRLRQILLNLLTNAIKFTPEGGQVIVSGTIVGGELRLRIRDNGVGMSESDIAYAMQPFHQLDTSPRNQSGTGLGLPLTKALTDAIRARLELTSEPGVGTSADVIFPHDRLVQS